MDRNNTARHRLVRLSACLPILTAAAFAQAPSTAPMPATQPAAPATQEAALAPQPAAPATQAAASAPLGSETIPGPEDMTLAPVIVTAERVSQRLQDVPISDTVVSGDTIKADQITTLDQAAEFVPNLLENKFSQARLASPFIRGIGSGENDPAVAEYIDGVPQLNLNVVNIELAGIDRIEFLRGPQGTLYGRNSLGGTINIFSRQPDNNFHFDEETTFGSYHEVDQRFDISGPLVKDKLYVAVAGGLFSREGYTLNDFNGNYIDGKDHVFGRVEVRYTPTKEWDLRLTVNGERDRDGDYTLYNLASLEDRPRHIEHDFPGKSDRDITQVAISAHYVGDSFDFTNVAALQHWRIQDIDDLDETAADLIRENNKESQQNLTEEFRFTNPAGKPIILSDSAKVRWVAGSLFFLSDYNQNKYYDYRPDAAAAGIVPFPFLQFNNGNLNDWSGSVYGQGTLVLWDKLEFTGGARYDHEHREARLFSFASSPFIPSTDLHDATNFDKVSPRFELAYHVNKDLLVYGTVAEGYRSGGFNVTAPAGGSEYGQENSWSYEAGVKTSLLDNRLTVNADAFYLEWNHLQLETPILNAPGEFYYANAGKAYSHGAEVEFGYHPTDWLELFGGVGLTQANFGAGSMSSGASVAGHDLPYAPDFTFNAGAQYTLRLQHDMRVYVRGEVFGVGRYSYDASDAVTQDNYYLADFRAGVAGVVNDGPFRGAGWRVEGWIKNAFNQKYFPIAFHFGGPANASGYVGESGDPQTLGVTIGLSF
jgi:iron complex outermembrane receptor protein